MARRFDNPPDAEFRYGVGSVVPAEFLNQLDDLLYFYADSILPTHTSTEVFIQATAGDEAQVVIDRRYFSRATSIYEPLVGDPGEYDLYAVASYIPTSHATTVKSFEAVIATQPPTDFEYSRHLAKVIFDGANITDVIQDPHKLNVEMLDGFLSSTEPSDGEVIPVASSSGRLARDFRPIFPGVEVELGEVIDYWLPNGHDLNNPPPGFAYCNGQTLGPTEQDITPGNLTLPALMSDEYIIGADPALPQGTLSGAADSAVQAPGVGVAKAAAFTGIPSHDHTTPAHTHHYGHTHRQTTGLEDFPHSHTAVTHQHNLTSNSIDRELWSLPWDPSDPRVGVDLALLATTQTVSESIRMPVARPAVSAATAVTDSVAHGSTSNTHNSLSEPWPWSVTFARLMKVKEV